MATEIMRRTAADNVYLHKDFHGALSVGIDYIHQRYGEEAVRDYLRQFVRTYYAPLIEDITLRGLSALKEHYERVYAQEGGVTAITCTEDEFTLIVEVNPAVGHMREHGYPVSVLFHETIATVNAALCEGTPFRAELVSYDAETGRNIQRFSRREPA